MNAGPAVLHEYQTMPLSLYTATIPSYLQILRAVSGLLDKAGTFCAERGIAAADLIEACSRRTPRRPRGTLRL